MRALIKCNNTVLEYTNMSMKDVEILADFNTRNQPTNTAVQVAFLPDSEPAWSDPFEWGLISK